MKTDNYLNDPVKFYKEKPIPVTFFLKKCPHCAKCMTTVRKMNCSWLRCDNGSCSYLTLPPKNAKNDGIEDVPVQYTSNFVRI
jgi:hypothetical protein